VRAPIKLNRAFWPNALTALLPSATDPGVLSKSDLHEVEFSDAVSTLKFATTFKTTRKVRFPLSLRILSSLEFAGAPVVLDVGASDGITSLDIMQAVRFSRYYVTDKHLEVFIQAQGHKTYFYAPDAKCVLIASPAWIVYEDTVGALPPFGAMARRLFAMAPKLQPDAKRISLVSPALVREPSSRVRVQQYDIFERWPHERADLVVAANVLNLLYFSEERLLQAIDNLLHALRESGRLAVIDNRDMEKATVFRMSGGRLHVEHSVNGGTEIESLVMASAAPAPGRVPESA
jgi:hypothetical protein